ncbi:ATP-dependent DNA helicase, partial [hydrothermal vent metagenome]
RVDILERLADLIRPLISFDPARHHGTPPEGAAKRNGFQVTVQMTSLLGCAGEDFASILKSLGYRIERTKIDPEKSGDPKASNGSDSPTGDTAKTEKEEDSKSVGDTDSAELAKLDGVEISPAEEKPEEDLEQLKNLDGAKTTSEQEPKTEQETATEQESKTPAEPEFLEIWFPVSRRPQNSNQNKSGSQSARKPNKKFTDKKAGNKNPRNNFAGSGNKSHANKRPAPKRKEKPIDPDSPFAALAALKLKAPKK